MEVSYTEDYFYYGPFGKDDYDEEIVHRVQTEYFPQLTWMLSLKCFVFIKRGFSTCNFYPDVCLDALIQWIFYKQQESGFKFERLWIQEPAIQDDVFEPVMIDSNVKSLLPGSLVNSNYEHEQLRSLQHIGRVGITENLFLPNVRFIQGYCVDSQVSISRQFQLRIRINYLMLSIAGTRYILPSPSKIGTLVVKRQ